jgi:hypothetical protein
MILKLQLHSSPALTVVVCFIGSIAKCSVMRCQFRKLLSNGSGLVEHGSYRGRGLKKSLNIWSTYK